MRNFKAITKEFNEVVVKIKKYIDENKSVFEYKDLKLYEASCPQFVKGSEDATWLVEIAEKIGDNNYMDEFYFMCEQEYDCFLDWMKEEGIEDNRQYIGRTSTFKLVPSHEFLSYDYGDNIDFDRESVDTFINNEYNGYTDIYYVLNDNGFIDSELLRKFCADSDNNIEQLKEDMEAFIEQGYNDFLSLVEDVVKVHEYIQGIKDNQCSILRDYIQCTIDDGAYDEFLNPSIEGEE